MKYLLRGLALAAILISLNSIHAANAQVTGACPTNQWVSVVNSNIVAQACSQPAMTNLSGTLGVAQGGTGRVTLTASSVLLGEGVAGLNGVAPPGTSGIPLIGQTAADPVFGTAVVAGGGTGAATFTAHGVMLGEGTSPLVPTAAGATGTILAGVTSNDPAFTATPAGLTSLGATTLNSTTTNGTTINAGADAVAGTVAIFPTTTATGKTTLTASSNSGATTTNINTAAQAGARTYTVPDQGVSSNFMLTGATVSATTGLTPTQLRMIDMRIATGLMMTASASGTNFGLTYTPATTAVLIGTATASNSTSDVATTDFVLPPWYKAGTDITLKVGCYYTDSSSSATVHTMTAAAYLNTLAGLQGSTLIATGAQVCPITTSAQQSFVITGATLIPGSLLTLKFTADVTNGGGASTEWMTSAQLN